MAREEDIIDLGVVNRGQVIDLKFNLKTVGSAPLVLEDVRAQCGCTALIPNSEPVAPGGSTVIEGTFDTMDLPDGPNVRTITVTSNDRSIRDRLLSIRADIRTEFRFSPLSIEMRPPGLTDQLPLTAPPLRVRVSGGSGANHAGTYAHRVAATGGYFRAMDLDVLKGQVFTDSEVRGSERLVVVSASLAQRLWASGDQVGSILSVGEGPTAIPARVIGVVEDVQPLLQELDTSATFYLSLSQLEQYDIPLAVVRTKTDVSPWASRIDSATRRVDARTRVVEVRAASDVAGTMTFPRRLAVGLAVAVAAAVLAVFLASAGTSAVTILAMRGRMAEFGIRMALGAKWTQVCRHIVVEVAVIAAIGTRGSVLGTVPIVRYIHRVLDWEGMPGSSMLAIGPVLVVVSTLTGALFPCWRVLRQSPTRLLGPTT